MHSSENRPVKSTNPKHKKDRRLEREETQKRFDNFNSGEFKVPVFQPITPKQNKLFKTIINNPLTISIGPAGTAKSYTGAAAAINLLIRKEISQIIVTRNPVPTGYTTGLKPGDTDEKLAPWVSPIMDNLMACCESADGGFGLFRYLKMTGKIRAMELESIKGGNIKDAFFLVEECQECSMEQLKNIVTRSCTGSYVYMDGDIAQGNKRLGGAKDFARFVEAVKSMNKHMDEHSEIYEDSTHSESWVGIRVPVIEFDKSDNVRSGVSRWMLEMFEVEEL